MIYHCSHWELVSGTKNVWQGMNSNNTKSVLVVKDIGCWVLDITYLNGGGHYSAHNTRDEAFRKAEEQACWLVDENFHPMVVDNGQTS